jgi:hypothetical protein
VGRDRGVCRLAAPQKIIGIDRFVAVHASLEEAIDAALAACDAD